MCVRQGVSQARIELSPASLGTIKIHLQRTAEGVIARVIAGHEAAQSFQQGADDLRRSLADHGVELLRLQIETSTRDAGSDQPATASARTSSTPATTSDTDPEPDVTPTNTANPGALVDVLA
jgi:flagellar hook-length control protein FliK